MTGAPTFFESNAGLFCEAQCGAAARVGHGHHEVGLHRRLARQLPAHRLAGHVHVLPENPTGGVREIDVLEHAHRLLLRGRVEAPAVQAVVVDADDLARLDVADVGRADRVERARLAGDAPLALRRLAEHQRPHAPGVADGFDPIVSSNTGLELVENMAQWDLRGKPIYDRRPEGGGRVTVTFPIKHP